MFDITRSPGRVLHPAGALAGLPASAHGSPFGAALEEPAARLVRRLKDSGESLATAESCTAGALACLLSGAPGASQALQAGFVVYTKAAKTMLLGVPADLLAGPGGAVTEPIARAMAAGARDRSPAAFGVAITGVAGPGPDEDGNPVGLAYVACAGSAGVVHRTLILAPDGREALCDAFMLAAIDLVERMLGHPIRQEAAQ